MSHWTRYISQPAWEHLGTQQEKMKSLAGDRALRFRALRALSIKSGLTQSFGNYTKNCRQNEMNKDYLKGMMFTGEINSLYLSYQVCLGGTKKSNSQGRV